MKPLGQYSGTLHAFEVSGCRVEQAILRQSEQRELSIELRGPCAALGLAPRDVVQIVLRAVPNETGAAGVADVEGKTATDDDTWFEGELAGRSGGFSGSVPVEGRLFRSGRDLVFVGRVSMGHARVGLVLDLLRGD